MMDYPFVNLRFENKEDKERFVLWYWSLPLEIRMMVLNMIQLMGEREAMRVMEIFKNYIIKK
jgi:hypothetical protein